MLTPEEIDYTKDCTRFLNTVVPHWKRDIISPADALQRGVGNCAARTMLAISYLGLDNIDSKFGIHRSHGTFKPNTQIRIMGHAVAFFSLSETPLVLESNIAGVSYITHFSPTDYTNFNVYEPLDGYTEYCERMLVATGINLSAVDEAVKSERVYLDELTAVTG